MNAHENKEALKKDKADQRANDILNETPPEAAYFLALVEKRLKMFNIDTEYDNSFEAEQRENDILNETFAEMRKKNEELKRTAEDKKDKEGAPSFDSIFKQTVQAKLSEAISNKDAKILERTIIDYSSKIDNETRKALKPSIDALQNQDKKTWLCFSMLLELEVPSDIDTQTVIAVAKDAVQNRHFNVLRKCINLNNESHREGIVQELLTINSLNTISVCFANAYLNDAHLITVGKNAIENGNIAILHYLVFEKHADTKTLLAHAQSLNATDKKETLNCKTYLELQSSVNDLKRVKIFLPLATVAATAISLIFLNTTAMIPAICTGVVITIASHLIPKALQAKNEKEKLALVNEPK